MTDPMKRIGIVARLRSVRGNRQAAEDLVSMVRLVIAPAKCTRETRWRSMSLALHGERHN
jgi:hypothetical protein